MTPTDAVHFIGQALWLALLLSGPPVLAAALVGLLVAIVQAATQVQEQTSAYALKAFALVLVLWAMAWTWGGTLLQYTDSVLANLARVSTR